MADEATFAGYVTQVFEEASVASYRLNNIDNYREGGVVNKFEIECGNY